MMKRYELRAMHMAIMGHIGRLYQLSRLLEETQAVDWTAEEMAAYAKEIHKTATDIQFNTTNMMGPSSTSRTNWKMKPTAQPTRVK